MTTMKPVVVRLYAVLVVLTLVGLVVWAGADWYQQRQAAQAQAQTALRQAAGQVTNLTIPPSLLDPTALGRVFAGALGDPRWKVVVLASPERGTEFYRGPRPLVPVDQAVPRWAPHQGTEVEVTLSVFRAGTTPLVLSGIFEFYGRAEVFALLKACGTTLVVLLVLTTIMVFLSSRARGTDQDQEPGPAEDAWAPEPQESSDAFSVPDLVEAPPLTEPESEDEYWFEDTPDFDLPPLDPPDESPIMVTPRVEVEPPLLAPSGLGWASFLETRLGQELERCAGQNQDLALVVIRPKDDPAPDWVQALIAAFPSVDLNFEHEGGAAVVLPGQSLEAALARAKALVGNSAVAGVASRNGRLLSASTLMAEAVSALNRARAGGMAVLGLKTDPDRWREHLAS